MAIVGAYASMSPIVVNILVGVASYSLAVVTTAVIVGIKWGRVTADIEYIKLSLAELKGTFVLKPKE